MPQFSSDNILLISPGSQVTLAQLGLPESFTPARFRFPTRMFPAEKKGEWEPHRIRGRVVIVKKVGSPKAPAAENSTSTSEGGPAVENTDSSKQDVEMKDAAEDKAKDTSTMEENGEKAAVAKTEEMTVYEEDTRSDEGAVYALRNGAVADWSCFFALLTHIYNTLSPPFHTPMIIIAQPAWTAGDRERLTQFVFEKFKTPAFCLMDSALAVCYAYNTPNATVIDVGHGKADVTAVTDFIVNEQGRGIALEGCGGQALTDRLLELLGPKGFTRDMCEKLKQTPICEILPPGTPLPKDNGPESASQDLAKQLPSTTPGMGPDMPRNLGGGEKEDDEGVLDVASIVSKGNASEFIAKREKEKAEKAASRKGQAAESAAARQARLPNSRKAKATFHYEGLVKPESASANQTQTVRQKKDIEVGIERLMAATPLESCADERCGYGILETLAAQIHHTILSVPEASSRSSLWDSLVILGNGSKIKGFPQALLSTITQKYVLSPSSGTIFTSEIPSTFSTPLATGANTPAQPQNPGPFLHPAAHGVNPLLVAATHSNNPGTPNNLNSNAALSADPNMLPYHKSTGHSQTPTGIKLLKPPEYFPEWKEQGSGGASGPLTGTNSPANPDANSGNSATGVASGSNNVGMEEATFLGAQVAAKVIFIVDQGASKGYLSRVEYNEVGPTAIHKYAL
ncbi:Actin-like protein arp9 [Microsporum audouinii]